MPRAFGLPGALVGPSVAHDRPAVVLAGFQNVDLIPAVRTVLVEPHLAGSRMHGEAQRAPVTKGVHLRLVAGASHERVVARNSAIVLEPQHLAALAVGI